MADDMANGTNGDSARLYQDAMQAQLGERVTNLGRRQSDLEAEMRTGFRQIETSFASFTNETRNSLSGLSSSIAERNKPQWQAIGVALTFAVVVGGMAYWPIRETTSDLKDAMTALASNVVTRQEMDWRQARGAEDRDRMQATIAEMRAQTVPRAEHDRTWSNYDQRFADTQRQIDVVKQAISGQYNQRDLNRDILERMDRIERERIRSGGVGP